MTHFRLGQMAFVAALGVMLLTPRADAGEDFGANKSYVIPAAELAGFVFGLSGANRAIGDEKDVYDTSFDTFGRNLRTAPVYDKDPFSTNQIGHPYQGGLYHGLARSTGHDYWTGLGYTLAGSFLWETFGETTKPSINDYVTTTIGGSFVGEALFRMASLLLEGGGDTPGFWRELGALAISPPTGFNRVVFGDRFRPIFPSRDPAIFVRFGLGATYVTRVSEAARTTDIRREEGSIDFSMTYGLPGKPGYRYTRPFDYFLFEFTGVPGASNVGNGVENATIRGLLLGTDYNLGADYRGLWGLFGGYDYLSPQIFRVSTTTLSAGTTAQWWLARAVALQGTLLGGLGFGAAGTVADRDERDYNYGLMPHGLLSLRLIFGDRAMLDAQGRYYYVAGLASGAEDSRGDIGHQHLNRATVSATVRLWGPHALAIQYLVSTRDARATGLFGRQQSIETVTLSYNFLGGTKFGAVEWRPDR
jgi:hypothetical protein